MLITHIFASSNTDTVVKRLVICSSKVNRNGYKVLAQGVILKHYLDNPVLLCMHDGKMLSIGKMTDIKLEDGPDGRQILTGMPEFDMDDEVGKNLARKYENGYINSCSMGHNPIEVSGDLTLADPGQVYETVTKTELLEISMTNVPGDREAVTMKLANGEVVSLPKLNLNHNHKTETEMSLVKIIAILGMAADANEDACVEAIKTLQLQVKESATKQVESLMTLGKANGHITDANEANYRKLATADYEAVSALLSVKTLDVKPTEEKPAKVESVADTLAKLSGERAERKEVIENFETLSKNDPEKLNQIRINEPEKYKKLADDYAKGK